MRLDISKPTVGFAFHLEFSGTSLGYLMAGHAEIEA